MSASPSSSSELSLLIKNQKLNYSNYLLILRHQAEALEKDEGDKLLHYRELETACRESLVSTDRNLRQAERLARLDHAAQAELAAEHKILESMRQEALAANAGVRALLERKMKEVKSELSELGATLRRLHGGNDPSGEAPLYIDVYS